MNNFIEIIRLFLIFTVFIFTSCNSKNRKNIFWYDLREKSEKSKLVLEFKSKNKIEKRTLYSNKTDKILLNEVAELFTVEHKSSFCTKIILTKEKIDIYIFPDNNVKEDANFYFLPENENIYAYFVEGYDSKLNRNYYIFSKDNRIDKQVDFAKIDFEIKELKETNWKDFAVYNTDAQILAAPYAGFVVKNSEGELIMLSTLWDSNSF